MARTPIYFHGRFGWLHTPESSAPGAYTTGVVLCAAFAQEEICTHYGTMALADELAAMGMPTIRFDYLGTGNSIAATVTVQSMVEDVREAAAYLRRECGVGPIVLSGLRLGAAIALLASRSIESVGALILMAPALSGSAFMRETRAGAKVSRLAALDPVPELESGQPLNTNGFHWSGELQQQVAALDLADTVPTGFPTLLLHARGDRRTGKIVAAWRTAGACITELPFADYELWMQDPTTTQVPHASFAAVRSWLAERSFATAPVSTPEPVHELGVLLADTFVEEPIRFGPNNDLFGVLCRPRDKRPFAVAALLLHEGSSHHIGDGGAYVPLARRLAAQGIASLRMDITGMGDSPAHDNPRHPHYDLERIAEGIAGVDLLVSRGCPHVVAFGLCAGAYTALHLTIADKRVVGNVIVNLQKFIWHYGDDIRITVRENRRSMKGYMRALRHPGEWKRALSGQVDLRAVATLIVKRAARSAYHGVRNMLPPAPDSEMARVHRIMKDLAARDVASTLIFADDDPGLAEMSKQFGRKARRLASFSPARMILLHEADHHFNGSSVRRRYNDLAESIMQAFTNTHGEAATPPPIPKKDRRRRPRVRHYQEG